MLNDCPLFDVTTPMASLKDSYDGKTGGNCKVVVQVEACIAPSTASKLTSMSIKFPTLLLPVTKHKKFLSSESNKNTMIFCF
jgi:hypothetical protein